MKITFEYYISYIELIFVVPVECNMHDVIINLFCFLLIFYYLSRLLLFSFLVDSEVIYRIIQL